MRDVVDARGHHHRHLHAGPNPPNDAVRPGHRAVLDDGIDAEPVALLLHGTPAVLDGARQRVHGSRDRARDVAPVVCQHGQMQHAPAVLGDVLGGAQYQIVILRAVETLAEPPDLVDHRPTQHREMTGVHRRAEPLGRPVGLQEVRRFASVGQHVCLVGVQVVDVGPCRAVERRHDLFERGGHQRVVVVEERHELAVGEAQCVVGRRDDAAVAFAVTYHHSWIGRGELVERSEHLGSRRTVVDDAPLPVRVRLRDHRPGTREEGAQRWIEHRSDDGEPRGDDR
jgi:hypothetical protein